MAEYKLLLPSMGEGVMEATVISWLFNEGDTVKEDDSVVEIATDKVDSDVPTPVSGKIIKILKQKDEVAKIGEAIAILEIAGENGAVGEQSQEPKTAEEVKTDIPQLTEAEVKELDKTISIPSTQIFSGDLYL
ncbi:MAG: biotin/lipoyl-containing protein, partial [Kaistella sp.]